MTQMKDITKLSIGLMIVALIVIVGTGVGSMMSESIFDQSEQVSSIVVYVQDSGTTATHMTAAIYDASTKEIIATTQENALETDAWNEFEFATPVEIDSKKNYILTAFADGDFVVPSSTEDYIIDTGNSYDTFPTTIDYNGTEDAELSIYAVYVP